MEENRTSKLRAKPNLPKVERSMSEYITNQIIMCKTSLERGRGPTIINVMSRRRMTKPKLQTHKAQPITTNMKSMWKRIKYKTDTITTNMMFINE